MHAVRLNSNPQTSEAYGASLRFGSIVHDMDKILKHSRFDHSHKPRFLMVHMDDSQCGADHKSKGRSFSIAEKILNLTVA